MSRADRVAGRLGEREVDLLLVSDLVNIRYLTGFTGTSAMAVVGADTRRFITDFRYVERARTEVTGFDRERARARARRSRRAGPRASAGWASRTSNVSVAGTRNCASCSRTASSWSARAAWSRPSAR